MPERSMGRKDVEGACPHGNIRSNCARCANEIKEARGILPEELSLDRAVFQETKQEPLKSSLPVVMFEVTGASGEIISLKYIYDPEHPDSWKLEVPPEHAGIEANITTPSPEVFAEAIYDFEGGRDISHRGVEIGDVVNERMSDLAFLYALAIGDERTTSTIRISDPKTSSGYENVERSVVSGFGDEKWGSGTETSTELRKRRYVSYDADKFPALAQTLKQLDGRIPLAEGVSGEEVKKATQRFFAECFFSLMRRTLRSWKESEDVNEEAASSIKTGHQILEGWQKDLKENRAWEDYELVREDVLERLKKVGETHGILEALQMDLPDQAERDMLAWNAERLLEDIPDALSKLEVLDPSLEKAIRAQLKELQVDWAELRRNPREQLRRVSELKTHITERVDGVAAQKEEVEEYYGNPETQENLDLLRGECKQVADRISRALFVLPPKSSFGRLTWEDIQRMRERFNSNREESKKERGDVALALAGLESIEHELRAADNKRYELLARIHPDWQTTEAQAFLELMEDPKAFEGTFVVHGSNVTTPDGVPLSSLWKYHFLDDGMGMTAVRYTRSGKPDGAGIPLTNGAFALMQQEYVGDVHYGPLWQIELDSGSGEVLRVVAPLLLDESAVQPVTAYTPPIEREPIHVPVTPSFSRSVPEVPRETIDREQIGQLSKKLEEYVTVLQVAGHLNPELQGRIDDLSEVIKKRMGLLEQTGVKKAEKEMKKFDAGVAEVLDRVKIPATWPDNWQERAGKVFGEIIPRLQQDPDSGLTYTDEKFNEVLQEVVGDAGVGDDELEEMILTFYT